MAEARNRRDFTRAEVLELLDYDPATGMFRWKVERNSHGGKIRPGDEAGGVDTNDGYVRVKLFGRLYRLQHIAWLIMTGEWPDPAVDLEHRNRNRADNAWANLRLATRSQNNMNAGLRSDNKSGQKGVSWRSDIEKWHARIKVGGKVILLGNFHNFDDAVAARRAAERQLFGEFAAAA